MSNEASTIAIPNALHKFIETRERRVSKAFGYNRKTLSDEFSRLIGGHIVRMGGRASCGPRVDPSWVEFVAWREIVRKAATLGIEIDASPVKHGNGWATKAGGFWDENDYRLKKWSRS